MKQNKTLFYYSILAGLVFAPIESGAAIRVGNLSRSNAAARQQVEDLRYKSTPEYQAEQAALAAQQAASAVPTELPVRVANKDVAEKVLSGDTSAGVDMAYLEKCSMIYPDGQFEWARPTVGAHANMSPRCTSVVEMRTMNERGDTLVLARVNVAAGDSVRCNISEWPENEWPGGSWLQDADGFEFPSDREPTIQDVVEIMDQEQKQNAGIKIAAAAVIGGLGGNVVGKSAPGSDAIIGTNKDKIQSTLIGVVGGAAIGAGNAFGGKVAGDMILSTGVNAAAGAVMGNITASGDEVLRFERCKVNNVEYSCLWGTVEERDALGNGEDAFVNLENLRDFRVCKQEVNASGENEYKCETADLSGGMVDGYSGRNRASDGKPFTLEDVKAENFVSVPTGDQFCMQDGKFKQIKWVDCTNEGDSKYAKITGAQKVSRRHPAMLVDIQDSAFGYKRSDWNNLKTDYKGPGIIGRGANGVATSLNIEGCKDETAKSGGNEQKETSPDKPSRDCLEYFEPIGLSAESGGLIDMDNKARMKGTLTGAGVGGALGAFTAYQGAQSDIQERWTTEVRAYKDSLQKVYCMTGGRFLSHYNDDVIIPAIPE
ncbi:MAG: hypothetical protein J6K82_04230 [Alphaproteobacteria bacterium]|nr:hypothetical protein [Alphaproteobacteria bacterium]